MQDSQKLQEENERLKTKLAQSQAETEAYKVAATKPPIIKRIQYAIFKPIEGILSFLFNTFKSFLDGRIFLGVVLTLGIAGFGYVVYLYGSLSLFIGVAILLTFIAWVFYMLKERAFQGQQEKFQQKLQQFSNSEDTSPLPLLLVNIIHSKTPTQRQQHAQQIKSEFKRLQPYLLDSVKFVKAYATKFLAFNSFLSLFTLLTSISIGIIAFLQLEKFERQNQLFEGQNELFKIQNQRVTEQTALMRSQDSLLRTQNRFLQRQLGQVDTQNLYIVKQIQQASIQNKLVTAQNKRLDQQTYLQEAERRSSLVFLFSNIMDAIDREIKEDYNNDSLRNISPQLIGQIIALASRLKPYKYLENDSLIKNPLSPERGQLLVSLIESKLDKLSYKAIFKKADFSYADLKNTNLKKANLEGANLERADFSYADLREANFRGAFSWQVIKQFEGDYQELFLENFFEQMNFKETNLSNTVFKYTRLEKVEMSGAKLINADFRKAYLQEAIMGGADLRGANFSNTDLFAVNLSNANLIGVNLNGADFSATDFSGITLDSITLKVIQENLN